MAGDAQPMRSAVIGSTLANVVGPVSIAAVAPLLTHALGPEGRGLVAAASVPFSLLSAALTIGIPEALTYAIGRKIIHHRAALRGAMAILLVSAAGAAAILWVLAPAMSVGSETVKALIRLSGLIFIPTQLLWAFRGYAQGLHDWGRINREKLISAVFRVVAIALMFIADELTIEAATLALIVAPATGLIAYTALGIAPKIPGCAQSSVGYLLSFGSKVWLGSIAGILLSRLDQVLIAPLSDATQLGYYAVAVNVGDLSLFATAAVGSVLLAKESSAPSNMRVAACSSLLFIAVGAVTIPLCASAFWWLPAIFGRDFEPSVAVAVVLLCTSVFGCSGSIAGATLTARGHPEVRSRSIVIGLVVNVVALVWMVPILGALGAGLATLAGMLTMTGINIVQMKRRLGIAPMRMLVPSRDTWSSVRRMMPRATR